MKAGRAATEDRESLWGDAAWETCRVCFQRFAYELEARCVACDDPLCPICAVRVREREELFCLDCEQAPESGRKP